ncbi:MAG: 1-hydroxycarotenoid 3,4-desaturase CrtD [Pseudomonadota bacterium]
MKKGDVVIVGAGVGGLTAAIDLAREGFQVTVVERGPEPGGKVRQETIGNTGVDAGPTVFTMRWIFEALFEEAGASFSDFVTLTSAETLARHAWTQGGALDLFTDLDRSADAIAAFASPADAQGYRDFCRQRAGIFSTLRSTFIANQRPSFVDFCRRVGLTNIDKLLGTRPLTTLWSELGRHFKDERLRQLFARYATYVGSSPWATPATLMLVAHVEHEGVWYVDGGMRALATGLQSFGETLGAEYRFNAHVKSIDVKDGAAVGVTLENGDTISADAVVFNGDSNALASGLLGDQATRATPGTPERARSLSAVTWCVEAEAEGFDLDHHNVFFSENYREEFDAIFQRGAFAQRPTVYLCAQDRGVNGAADGPEHMLLLINAPADGDKKQYRDDEIEDLQGRMLAVLADCGLRLRFADHAPVVTTPTDFNARFPATGGALYGRASHGMTASFQRPGASTKVGGLYLAGGSTHPGPGVPMAAMSGRLAAARLSHDTLN